MAYDVPTPEIDLYLSQLLGEEKLELAAVIEAASGTADEEKRFHHWLHRGCHGNMTWMERSSAARYRPEAILPGCRSILFVGLNYYQAAGGAGRDAARGVAADAGRDALAPSLAGAVGRVARYAAGRDYHRELGKRIKRIARRLESAFPRERFRAWTDATPLAERYYAERAGLGFTGRNTLLINPQYGSWFVLGEILSTATLTPFRRDAPERAASHEGAACRIREPAPVHEGARGRNTTPDHATDSDYGGCPRWCRRCLDACPTGALIGPGRIDARRCISYLTVEHKETIPPLLARRMGDWLFGCDVCQEVCPLNAGVGTTDVAGFLRPIAGTHVPVRELLRLKNDDHVRERFAGSPLVRARRRGLVRNACIVAGNVGDRECLQELADCADDEDRVIAFHAASAMEKLERDDE